MQAVILASGKGVRMGDLVKDCPKPMLPILGKPLLAWKLEMLPEAVDEVVFVIGYLGDRIRAYFGDEWHGRRVQYVEQAVLDGTGGAMMLLSGIVHDPFLVMMGDDFYHPDDAVDLLALSAGQLAVLGLRVSDAEQYGLLETTAAGNLVKITERPHGKKEGTINTGAYILDQRYFDYPPVKFCETEYGLPQALAVLGQDVPVKVLAARAWQPIGRPEDIAKGEEFLRRYWHV